MVCHVRKYVIILAGIFPLTSPNQNIGGCVPGIPGGVDASVWPCVCLRLSVCLSVCLSQIAVLNESSWFLARELAFTYPTLCYKKIWVSPKMLYLNLELCPKLRIIEKISASHIDRRKVLSTELDNVDAQSVMNWTVVSQYTRPKYQVPLHGPDTTRLAGDRRRHNELCLRPASATVCSGLV